MKVRELRELLMQFPDDAVIFEERDAEHRELNRTDVFTATQVSDSDSGHVLNAGDQQPSDPALAWLAKCPLFVIFGAWR